MRCRAAIPLAFALAVVPFSCANEAQSRSKPAQRSEVRQSETKDQPQKMMIVTSMVKTCACLCGDVYFEVDPETPTCKGVEKQPCVTRDGKVSKLSDCGMRYITVSRKVPVDAKKSAGKSSRADAARRR